MNQTTMGSEQIVQALSEEVQTLKLALLEAKAENLSMSLQIEAYKENRALLTYLKESLEKELTGLQLQLAEELKQAG